MPISSIDPHPRRRVAVLDTEISYIDTGFGRPVVFLHGNPTSSYLWRNIVPHLRTLARCLAPDLVGMGRSEPAPNGSYRFVDHSRYIDTWFSALGLTERVILVGHDWGSALAFDWACRHRDQVGGIIYMEAIVQAMTWEQWPEAATRVFQGFRSESGEDMVLDNNVFVERVLPGSIIRTLTANEMDVYRRPFTEPGESRRPTLTWPREIPLDGQPADVVGIVNDYSAWLAQSALPKLFINAEPGAILTGSQRDFCRTWPNQTEVTVKGVHFIQEDSPDEIGLAIAEWIRLLD